MKQSNHIRQIVAGILIAAACFGWYVLTEGKIPQVVRYDGGDEPLVEKWKWALNEGKSVQDHDAFWIGYSVTKWMSPHEFYGDDCIYRRGGGRTIQQLISGDTIIRLEETDEGDDLRRITLGALKNLGDDEAAEKLQREYHDDEDRAERDLAILAYYETTKNTPRLEDVKIRRMDRRYEPEGDVLYWLGHTEDGESIDLLWDLFHEADRLKLQKHIATAIGVHDAPKEVVPLLEKIACGDYREKLRENAIFWLGQQKGEESLRVLKRLLRDERDFELREKVIFSIYCYGGEEAISILSDAARGDRSTKVRKEAVFWLGQLAAAKTLDILSDIAIDSEETEIQEHAVFAISQHSDDEAVPTLIKIAKTHRNPEVRKKAIFWLGQTEDERALDFFVELLKGD
ncbi:MAG: HEAT repeat domain-containing protein [Gemmatimonadota bacterium]|nr:MAG: HEAT repeat domain-containing protein [Gemmatimonadota bacterium]